MGKRRLTPACRGGTPHTVKVKKGKHTFQVQAVDQAGNVGAPATDTWKRKKRRSSAAAARSLAPFSAAFAPGKGITRDGSAPTARRARCVAERANESAPPSSQRDTERAMSQERDATPSEGGEMILSTVKVEDFDRFWNTFSTKGAEKRRQHGSKGSLVFRDPNEDNRIWVIFDMDEDGYSALLSDPEMPAIFQEAGLQGRPQSAKLAREHDA